MAANITHTLDLSNRGIDSTSLTGYQDQLKSASHILLQGNYLLESQGICSLLDICNRNIITLDISACKIGDEGLLTLTSKIHQFSLLQSLAIRRTDASPSSLAQFCNEIARHPNIEAIDMSYHQFDDTAFDALVAFAQTSPKLNSLNLRYSNFCTERPLAVFFNQLKQADKIRSLNLSCVHMSIDNLHALSLSMMTVAIRELNLDNTDMNSTGLKAMQPLLLSHRSLTHLSLMNNSFGEDGGAILSEILKENHSLRYLNIQGCDLGKGGQAIGSALGSNDSLTSLNLRANHLTNEAIHTISISLTLNRTLQELDLEHNHLQLISAKELISSLASNHQIKRINLKSNCFYQEDILPLMNKAVIKSPSIIIEADKTLESNSSSSSSSSSTTSSSSNS